MGVSIWVYIFTQRSIHIRRVWVSGGSPGEAVKPRHTASPLYYIIIKDKYFSFKYFFAFE